MSGIGDIFKSLFELIFKIIAILLPFVIIGAGVYCSVILYENITSRSMTLGQINEHDVWEDFNIFDCDLSDAIFYQTASGYEFNETIPQAVAFNGNLNKYNVLINNLPSSYETSTAGRLSSTYDINYYTVDGNNFLQMQLALDLTFYQSEIEISITTDNTAQEQAYFLEYMRFNGLHLRIIEAQYTIATPETQTYTVTFFDKDNSVIAIQTYNRGATLTPPTAPQHEGYVFLGWSPTLPSVVTSNMIFTALYRELPQGGYYIADYDRYLAYVLVDDTENHDIYNNFSNLKSITLDGTMSCRLLDGTESTITFNNLEISIASNEFVYEGDTANYYATTQSVDLMFTEVNSVKTHKITGNLSLTASNFDDYPLMGNTATDCEIEINFQQFIQQILDLDLVVIFNYTPEQVPEETNSYLRIIVNNELYDFISLETINEAFDIRDMTLTEYYPYLQGNIGDYTGEYFEIDIGTVLPRYDIYITTNANSVTISLGDISQTYNFEDLRGITFNIRFMNASSYIMNDNLYYEFEITL